MNRRTLLCAVLGAVGGALAYFIASPFLRDVASQNIHPSFTLGSVFGWLSHALLGAFIVAPIAAVIGFSEYGSKGAWKCFGAGIALGAIGGYASDALYDWMMIPISGNLFIFGRYMHIFWSLFVAIALSLAIFLATGAKRDRIKKCLIAAALATVCGTIARRSVSIFASMGLLVRLFQGSYDSGDRWVRAGPGMLAEFCVLGFVIGAIYGLVETYSPASKLRLLLGRNEWKSWSLTEAGYRIGSHESCEIRIDSLEREHARLVKQDSQYCIQEAAGGLVVNGIPTPAHWLSNGDVIQLGSSTLFFGEGNPSHPLPSAAETGVSSATPSTADHRLIDSFGNVVSLKPGTYLLGRDPSADIPLTWDDKVSRRHAEIQIGPDGVQVSDLGSRNGTMVNGVPIQAPVQILSGDQIQLGSTVWTYRS